MASKYNDQIFTKLVADPATAYNEGKWCSSYQAISFAESRNIPIMGMWCGSSCPKCEKIVDHLSEDDFRNW